MSRMHRPREDTMSYTSLRTDRELSGHYVKGEYADGATEYALEYESYTEYEGAYEFYHERTYYFTGANGEEWTWQTEDEATEWLEKNGYSNDY